MAKKISLDIIVNAYFAFNGKKTQIAKFLNIDRSTLWVWLNKDEVKKAIEEGKEDVKERIELSLERNAEGIANIDKETGEFLGWKEKPDLQSMKLWLSKNTDKYADKKDDELEQQTVSVTELLSSLDTETILKIKEAQEKLLGGKEDEKYSD